MDKIKILWADDEIDLLKPHIMFLQSKGYDVVTASNGHDAVEIYGEQMDEIDVVFLDESMPGLTVWKCCHGSRNATRPCRWC